MLVSGHVTSPVHPPPLALSAHPATARLVPTVNQVIAQVLSLYTSLELAMLLSSSTAMTSSGWSSAEVRAIN